MDDYKKGIIESAQRQRQGRENAERAIQEQRKHEERLTRIIADVEKEKLSEFKKLNDEIVRLTDEVQKANKKSVIAVAVATISFLATVGGFILSILGAFD